MSVDKFRGYNIEEIDGKWVFSDTNEPVAETWQDRPCGHCGLENTSEGHDGCIGTLPGVINACCGHGQTSEAYVQYECGEIVEGDEALSIINENIPYSPRSAAEAFADFIGRGFSAKDAFVIAATTLADYPSRCGEELPALVRAYERTSR